jgi:hypothetical protein
MSVELSYQTYDDKSLIVFGDRRKFQKQINLLGGRWNSRKEGWLLPVVNRNKLDGFISSLTPDETSHDKTYHREDSESESNESEKEDIAPLPLEKLPEIESIFEKPEDDAKSRQSNQSSEKINSRREDDERRLLEYRRRDEENRLRERRKREELKRRDEENHAKRKYGKQDPMVFNKSFKEDSDGEDNPYEYYKSFNKKPIDFRKMHNISDSEDESESVEESSEYSESSSDGFPSPSTPRRRDDYRKTDHKTYNELYNKVQDLQRRMTEMEIDNRRRR